MAEMDGMAGGLQVGHSVERTDLQIGGATDGPPLGYQVRSAGEHAGYPMPSDTYRWGDQGTEWAPDSFTAMVMMHGAAPISRPAPHSYDGDGNMEAYRIAGPYARDNEAATDLGMFTGATGPTGHVTPMNHPELTAPASPSTTADGAAPAPSVV